MVGVSQGFRVEWKELQYQGELGPAWAEARVMPQTVRVSALSAHSSQWSWLGIGEQQSSCTGHVLICHTEWGSDVYKPSRAYSVSKPDMGSD